MAQAYNIKVVGLQAAINNLKALGPAAIDASKMLLTNFADTKIVKPAKEKYVPVVTGNLSSTIMASEPTVRGQRISVIVSAGGPAIKYAAKVHENPRSGKTDRKSVV